LPFLLAIMLARIKMSYSEIKNSILSLDGKLSIDVIKSLKQFTPTEEEVILFYFIFSSY